MWLHIEPPTVWEIILLIIFQDKLFEANLTSVQLPSFCDENYFQYTFYNVFIPEIKADLSLIVRLKSNLFVRNKKDM